MLINLILSITMPLYSFKIKDLGQFSSYKHVKTAYNSIKNTSLHAIFVYGRFPNPHLALY